MFKKEKKIFNEKSSFHVIIPTYNQSQYLEKALSSVINQKYNNFEIIVIDNYSVDKTEEIVKKFKNNKIKYLKKNYGVIGSSRNEGIKISTGEWIAFLDLMIFGMKIN